jgi:hypothetical protein
MSFLPARLQFFQVPLLALAGGVALAFAFGGAEQAFVVAVLAVFEVALSFNNAVINATVLERMNRYWQRLFLTLGLLIAVFGVRLVLPILLVSATTSLGFGSVVDLALRNPDAYAAALTSAHSAIAAFGGIFLLMMFLDFLIDESKGVHWIAVIERPLAKAGQLKTLSVLIALSALWLVSVTWAGDDSAKVVVAGIAGLVTYLAVRGLSQLFAGFGIVKSEQTVAVGKAALMLFIYLEVLDAAFSFDGVIGAFAITNNVLAIALGLGIGALFVRELTIWLVRHETLKEFVYLEHGAQYSVGALAVLLAVGLAYDVPEVVTGLAGAAIIGLALWSSLRHRKQA